MDNYLFRISTKCSDVWSYAIPKPVYYVARNKEEALTWANSKLKQGLSVHKISKLGVQVGTCVFTGL